MFGVAAPASFGSSPLLRTSESVDTGLGIGLIPFSQQRPLQFPELLSTSEAQHHPRHEVRRHNSEHLHLVLYGRVSLEEVAAGWLVGCLVRGSRSCIDSRAPDKAEASGWWSGRQQILTGWLATSFASLINESFLVRRTAFDTIGETARCPQLHTSKTKVNHIVESCKHRPEPTVRIGHAQRHHDCVFALFWMSG